MIKMHMTAYIHLKRSTALAYDPRPKVRDGASCLQRQGSIWRYVIFAAKLSEVTKTARIMMTRILDAIDVKTEKAGDD